MSNRYYDLGPILANAADRLWMHALEQIATASDETAAETGRTRSRAVLMARDAAALARFAAVPAWKPLEGGGVVCTDDQANVLAAIR